ncbi:DUF4893 domain-containing protein [Sphingomonas sp. MMS24-JH45]
MRLGRIGAASREGLAGARASDPGAVANAGGLLDPAAALPDAMPPPGDYRCRVLKLGARAKEMPGYVAYPWFACRLSGGKGARRFVKLTGSQRQVGTIYPARDDRAAFFGHAAIWLRAAGAGLRSRSPARRWPAGSSASARVAGGSRCPIRRSNRSST